MENEDSKIEDLNSDQMFLYYFKEDLKTVKRTTFQHILGKFKYNLEFLIALTVTLVSYRYMTHDYLIPFFEITLISQKADQEGAVLFCVIIFLVFHLFFFLFVISFIRISLSDPGYVEEPYDNLFNLSTVNSKLSDVKLDHPAEDQS